MSETSTTASTTDTVTITVDGQEIQAPKGAMLIEVTDAHNITVPRFCYHKKLSVAANCRMCLVEVEKAPKPLPACATPVMDGMVVHTRSKVTRDAQQSVMEFLLINHPLDCPVCDQGGECELQDLSEGYGSGISQFVEYKHVVFDKNIGPLIATELTRCIHCTRCVRFGQEIAGVRELGMTGRGEHAVISAFIDDCVNSELSGNVIDVCPVGALTAKPSRFKGRAWEMLRHKTIAPHDCLGSNIYVHTLRGKIERVVPRENEDINEVWLSDRDRFSYEGLHTADRLQQPMIKHNGQWQSVAWEEALQLVADKFKAAAKLNMGSSPMAKTEDDVAEDEHQADAAREQGGEIAALVSASSTLEEQYLTQKLCRGLGSGNIDFRLRQSDFSDQHVAPVMPWLGQSIAQLEKLDAALLIGSNIRKEQPIANLRLRKAVVNNQAQISFLNPREYELNYPLAYNIAVAPQNMVAELAAIAAVVFKLGGSKVPANLKAALAAAKPNNTHKAVAKQLMDADSATVLLGNIAAMHPQFSALRTLADAIARQTDSRLGYLTEGANAAGAWLAGAVPHRGAGGRNEDSHKEDGHNEDGHGQDGHEHDNISGKHLADLMDETLAACLLVNIEPDTDAGDAAKLIAALQRADFVVSISAYQSTSLKQVADVMLPAANFTETSGTYVNVEGYWQSFKGIITPPGEARPAWKILRVLGNMVGVDGFDYLSSEDVKSEVRCHCESIELDNTLTTPVKLQPLQPSDKLHRAADVPIYATDAIVRRARSLQQTMDAQTQSVSINQREARRLGLGEVNSVQVTQDSNSVGLPLVIDECVPDGCVWIPSAVEGNALLGAAFGEIELVAIELAAINEGQGA